MTRDVRVHLLPELFEPEEVRDGIAVILDILRASTTIVHALAHGATAVIPTLETSTALELARQLPAGTVLTGGEREGKLIPGFDLDNNPFAYTHEVVIQKTLVFTTSNGTKALLRAQQASRVLVGACVNLSAVVNVLASSDRPVHLVCAGTMGRITVEDAMCAGAIASRLAIQSGADIKDWTDDSLQLALSLYQRASTSPTTWLQTMRNSFGGRNCRRLGFDEQIERAATFDLFQIAPEYSTNTGQITV